MGNKIVAVNTLVRGLFQGRKNTEIEIFRSVIEGAQTVKCKP